MNLFLLVLIFQLVIQQMLAASVQRFNCGVPDLIERRRTKRYLLAPKKGWKKQHLTYYIANKSRTISHNDVRRDIDRALKVWAKHSKLTFQETADPNADIIFSFGVLDHGDRYPFEPGSATAAHAFHPNEHGDLAGDVHFNDEHKFFGSSDPNKEGINFFNTAVHELGHSLGLQHSNIKGSIMFPILQFFEYTDLHEDDIAGIRELYLNAEDESRSPFSSTSTTTTQHKFTYTSTYRTSTTTAYDPRYLPNDRQDRYHPETPQNPRQPQYPQNPQYPEHPQNPQHPQNPNYPQNPRYPQNPDYPQNPRNPSFPEHRQKPEYPQNPRYPQQPEQRQRPSSEQNPRYPQNPSYPQNPDYPQNPRNPSYPENRQRPEYPQNPRNPQQPEQPQRPSTEQNPYRPQHPHYPQNPQHPQNPQYPQTPHYPQNPRLPENPQYTRNPHYTQHTQNPYTTTRRSTTPRSAYETSATTKKPIPPTRVRPTTPSNKSTPRIPKYPSPSAPKRPKNTFDSEDIFEYLKNNRQYLEEKRIITHFMDSSYYPENCTGIAEIRGELYFFSGTNVTRVINYLEDAQGYTEPISRSFFHFPENLQKIDAAYERPNGNLVFFSGNQVFIHNGIQMSRMTSISFEFGLPGWVQRIDNVFKIPGDKFTYFYYGDFFWAYNEETSRMEPNVRQVVKWRDCRYAMVYL